MRKLFCILHFAFFIAFSARAQTEKRVEVSKPYVPSVEHAEKLPVKPDMTDTVTMRPEIDYSITPLRGETGVETRSFRPATVTYWEFDRPLPFYVKAGLGFPFNSSADLYVSTQNPDIGYALGYINHDGLYRRLPGTPKNGNALWMDNKVGGAGGWYLGRRLLEGGLSYENRLNDRYFLFPDSRESLVSRKNRITNDLLLGLRFGDDFADLSRLNFNVSVTAGAWWSPSIDLWRYRTMDMAAAETARQFDLGFRGAIGRRFGEHKALLEIAYDGAWSVFDDRYHTLSISPRYAYQTRLVDFEVGLDYHYDRIAGQGHHYPIPYAHLRFNPGDGAFVPFIELDGRHRRNDLRTLLGQNRYYDASDVQDFHLQRSTVDYSLRAGVAGRLLHDRFGYRVFIDYTITENHNFWYVAEDFDAFRFDLEQGGLHTISLGGELEYRPWSNLSLSAKARLSTYTEHERVAVFLPEFEGKLEARYRHRKFSVGLGFDLTSRRHLSLMDEAGTITDRRTPFAPDLGLDVNWFVSKHVTVYAEGRNLCNGTIYDWSRMPLPGVRFTVGVKVQF